MSNRNYFLFTLCIPLLILLGMTVKPLQAVYLGEVVKLQTAPVDPRDLFYGDYVILDFEIERLPIELLDETLANDFELVNNEYVQYKGKEDILSVYLLLEANEEGIHEAVSISKAVPKSGTYMKGSLYTYASQGEELLINIPIERYYLEENTGQQLEEDARQGRIVATLHVYKGYPILKEVSVKR